MGRIKTRERHWIILGVEARTRKQIGLDRGICGLIRHVILLEVRANDRE